MKICGTKFGDFVVWRENKLVAERIAIHEPQLEVAIERATYLFIPWPEALVKWYSRLPQYAHPHQQENFENQPEPLSGALVARVSWGK